MTTLNKARMSSLKKKLDELEEVKEEFIAKEAEVKDEEKKIKKSKIKK